MIDSTILNQYDSYTKTFGGYKDKTDYIAVILNNKIGLLNIYGDILIEPKYDLIGICIMNEYVRVSLDGKWGFVDINDNIIIPIMYDSVDVINNGVAKVELNNEEFFINLKNERVDNVTGYYDEE